MQDAPFGKCWANSSYYKFSCLSFLCVRFHFTTNQKFPITDTPENPYLKFKNSYLNLEKSNKDNYKLKLSRKFYGIKPNTHVLTLTGTKNQIITLKYTEPGKSEVTVNSTNINQEFIVKHNTIYSANIAGIRAYKPAPLNYSSGIVSSDIKIKALYDASIDISQKYTGNNRMSYIYPDTYETMTSINLSEVEKKEPGFLSKIHLSGDRMFYMCEATTTINGLNNLDTSYMTETPYMFGGCISLTSISQLDMHDVTNMESMFSSCWNLTSISLLNTNNVTSMDGTFSGCKALTTISQLDTSKVKDMCYMFSGCTSLPSEFPWVIDCSSIEYSNYWRKFSMYDMFWRSSVTKVKLKNVSSSKRREITSQLLKEDNTLTIEFV